MSDTPESRLAAFLREPGPSQSEIIQGELIEDMERELTALRSDIERHVRAAADLANEAADLRAENERLLEDAERYRWLRDSSFDGPLTVVKASGTGRSISHLQLDAAIDAARKEIKCHG